MNIIIYDRIFWIYFSVTLFFIIIGMTSMISYATNLKTLIISMIWLISMILLMIVIYHASLTWGPKDPQCGSAICVADPQSGCFESNNRIWLMINIIFVVLLLLSTLWANEINNSIASMSSVKISDMASILIILGGLWLFSLNFYNRNNNNSNILSYWIIVCYVILWFGLSFYSVTS